MSRNLLACSLPAWLLLLGTALSTTAAETPILRWQTDYLVAHKIRMQRRMPMLVFLTMDGCPHCHRMLATTYRDKVVAREVSGTYVPIVINGTHQEELASRFRVRVYPTTFIVGSDNRIVDRMEGYVTAQEMRQRLATLTQRQASRPKPNQPTGR